MCIDYFQESTVKMTSMRFIHASALSETKKPQQQPYSNNFHCASMFAYWMKNNQKEEALRLLKCRNSELHKRKQHYRDSRPPLIPPSIFFDTITLQQAGAEKGADEHNSAADERSLAHLAGEHRVGSSAGRSSRSSASAGSTAGSSVGSDGSDAAGTSRGSRSRLAAGVLTASALETGTLAGAVGHVLVGSVGDSGKVLTIEVLDLPGVAVGRAFGGLAIGLVAAVAGGGRVVAELLHEVLEVVVLGVGVAADGAETVLGFLLGVLVDETTGVDGGHVIVVEGLDGAEGTCVLVAAVLGKAEGS